MEPRPLDPRLVDDARAEEIALVARLLLAARHDDEPLTQEAIDEALGVDADPSAEATESPPADDGDDA